MCVSLSQHQHLILKTLWQSKRKDIDPAFFFDCERASERRAAASKTLASYYGQQQEKKEKTKKSIEKKHSFPFGYIPGLV